jgi:hypothetical protein
VKWTVSKTAKGATVIVDEKGRNVCMFGWHWPLMVKTNSRMIAAAPGMLAALKKAAQLVDIAADWNLDEVEIDGEMVRTYALRDEFNALIGKAEGRES